MLLEDGFSIAESLANIPSSVQHIGSNHQIVTARTDALVS